jgi:glutamate-1-semialdehyde 2,1-aminomutase
VTKCSGQELYEKAKRRLPGGTQLLSKRPELFLPDQWPAYYSKAKGVETWDLDGHKYIDMSICGIGATVLGFADADVDEAVCRAVASGSMATLNCPEEVELAELLCELHPWAEMVRYGRCGGEAMAIAVRIARAKTGRDIVAFCGYHGWHDWYLAANLAEGAHLDGHLLPGLEPAGVPRALAGTALPFQYNQIDELKAIVSANGQKLAAIVMEPVRDHDAADGFLEAIRQIATDAGAVLIFDEVTSGWRLNTGGIHMRLGVTPDIAVFAKGMSNGYPMAAIIGKARIMEAAQNTFISSTYWTEKIGLVAALTTIRKHRRLEVGKHLEAMGQLVQTGWQEAAARSGLALHVSGIAPLGHFSFVGYESGPAMHTLFVQLLLERGFLAKNSFYAMFAHQRHHVEAYLAAVNEAFDQIAVAEAEGGVVALLKGPIAHSGFRRLT